MKLGKHFTLDELTHSQVASRAGLKNEPTAKEIESLKLLVEKILDPLRVAAGAPVVVSSGFRNKRVNDLVGSNDSSQHRLGEAADITIPGMTTDEIVALIRRKGLPFDQLIEEFGSWVHVSYGPRNRRQVLRARKVGARTVYTPLP